MIGDIVHFTRASGTTSRSPQCHPAIVITELPNDKLDVLVFAMNALPVAQANVAKGERTRVGNWHNADHKER